MAAPLLNILTIKTSLLTGSSFQIHLERDLLWKNWKKLRPNFFTILIFTITILQGDHYCSFWWKASPNAGAELIALKNCIILNYDNRLISSMQLQGAIISIYIFACPLQVTKMSKGKERLDYNHNEHENFKKF